MGNTQKIREILDKMPRWKNRIPKGDTLREIERKLSYYGEGYSDHDLDVLSREVDAEVARMFDRSKQSRERKAARNEAQARREADNARRFGTR